ncbi:alpha/beta fold hydrolase [Vagococcus silagei]|uniref:prolyl aminopeptidase n=1 Tax=Vagococcus silagei TaxID=2508885 RepID=A0A4S3B4T8_9ENTE|nr:alpha/beta fold hydrolase [Vagococcus silagei]THB62154.1 alpha/beta fold hydrolase [Vagococcus silagei]
MKRVSKIESVTINHKKLFFSVSHQNQDAPIILYLHGGPGDSCVPLTQKFNHQLEEKYIFVNLEQRGSGLSYYPFPSEEILTLDSFVDDAYKFVLYLLARFNQEKLILIGHSWGSVLGLKLVEKYPQLIKTYIGIGQVVNMRKNELLQKAFVEEKEGKSLDSLDFERNVIKKVYC